MVTIAEAVKRLGVSRATFYNELKASGRTIRRWKKAGDRRMLYDMRQLRPLFEKPREIK